MIWIKNTTELICRVEMPDLFFDFLDQNLLCFDFLHNFECFDFLLNLIIFNFLDFLSLQFVCSNPHKYVPTFPTKKGFVLTISTSIYGQLSRSIKSDVLMLVDKFESWNSILIWIKKYNATYLPGRNAQFMF